MINHNANHGIQIIGTNPGIHLGKCLSIYKWRSQKLQTRQMAISTGTQLSGKKQGKTKKEWNLKCKVIYINKLNIQKIIYIYTYILPILRYIAILKKI